ncbi:MAG: type II secretion system F family protein [Phycisphaerales bacterium]
MKFKCTAYSKAGESVVEIVEAASAEEASERVRKRGLFVVSVARDNDRDNPAPGKRRARSRRASPKQVAVFAREMSVLISTGTPVLEALTAIERQSSHEGARAAIAAVREQVEEGVPLSEAMAEQPQMFDAVSRSLVAAGESSGQLDTMLDRLSSLARRQAAAQSAIMGAMIYPVLLIGIAIIVLALMVTFVLPRFGGLFETLDTPLPPTTEVLMVLSGVLRSYWWGIVPGLVVGIAGAVFWLRSPKGMEFRDTAILRLPRFGKLVRSFVTARITRLLGVLLESKVPLMEALPLTRAAMSNQNYVRLIERAEEQVTKGDSVSGAFSGTDLISPSVCEAIRNGEQSGKLGDVLLSVADYLDSENETVIRSLSSLIEPVIMIVLGLIVGFVAVSMFLPLFDLTASAGGGGPPV